MIHNSQTIISWCHNSHFMCLTLLFAGPNTPLSGISLQVYSKGNIHLLTLQNRCYSEKYDIKLQELQE